MSILTKTEMPCDFPCMLDGMPVPQWTVFSVLYSMKRIIFDTESHPFIPVLFAISWPSGSSVQWDCSVIPFAFSDENVRVMAWFINQFFQLPLYTTLWAIIFSKNQKPRVWVLTSLYCSEQWPVPWRLDKSAGDAPVMSRENEDLWPHVLQLRGPVACCRSGNTGPTPNDLNSVKQRIKDTTWAQFTEID